MCFFKFIRSVILLFLTIFSLSKFLIFGISGLILSGCGNMLNNNSKDNILLTQSTTSEIKKNAETNAKDLTEVAKHLSLEIHTKTELSSRNEPSAIDRFAIAASHIGINYSITGQNIRKFIAENYQIKEQPKNEISISMRLSLSPSLLKEHTNSTMHNKLDQKLQRERDNYLKLISGAVMQKIGNSLDALPHAQRSQIIGKLIKDAMQQVDAKLMQVRAIKSNEIKKRIDQIQLETSIQELALNYATTVGNGNTILFFKAGKFGVNGGASTDNQNQTLLESYRPGNSAVQRANSTQGTGAFDLGIIYQKAGYSVRVDAYFYHYRLPFINADDYIANIVMIDKDIYEQHKRWFKIDSAMLRVLISGSQGEIYLTVADTQGDNLAVGAGAIYKLTKDDLIQVDVSYGNKQFMKAGASLFFVHNVNNRFVIYGGVEYEKDRFIPLFSMATNNKATTTATVAGLSYLIVDNKNFNIRLSTEYKKYLQSSEANLNNDFFLGANLTWRF